MRLATFLLCTWTFVVLGAGPAAASCATDSPARSPDAFVGTVIATSEGDRVAEVVTDDGVTVIVRGMSGTGDAFTSVDRRYALGGRYEFHPLDDNSSYEDNDCTATRQLSGPTSSAIPASQADDGLLPEMLPVDEQAGPLGYVVFFGSVVVGALALFAVLRGLMRKRRGAGVS